MDEAVWDATMFTKNRQRVIDDAVTARLLEAVLDKARQRRLLCPDSISVWTPR